MEFKTVFFLFGIFAFSAVGVDALRCYNCQGTNDGSCFDPVEQNASTIDCINIVGNAIEAVCFKTLGTSGGNQIVNRGCFMESSVELYCAANIALDLECVYCKEELCNGSNSINIFSITFLLFSLAIAKLF